MSIRYVNSGVTGRGPGGQSAPWDFWPGNFCWRIGKKEARKKGKRGWKLRRKEGKLWKGRWKIGNGSRKSYTKRWGLFFAFHFWKRRKFVLGLPKWGFYTGKKHFTLGKIQEKMTLPPQKNMPVMPLYVNEGTLFKIFIAPHWQYFRGTLFLRHSVHTCLLTLKLQSHKNKFSVRYGVNLPPPIRLTCRIISFWFWWY